MKCSLDISNFLEEISSLSYSLVFLYVFALITEEHFLISPWYSLELYIEMGISFLSSFVFGFSFFTAICKASPDNHFAFLHFFSMEMVLIPVSCMMSRTSVHSLSGTLSIYLCIFFVNTKSEQSLMFPIWLRYILFSLFIQTIRKGKPNVLTIKSVQIMRT